MNKGMLKILYIQSTSEIGGSDIALLRLVEQLDKKRFEPVVMLPEFGPMGESLEKAGARVILVPAMLKLTSRKGAVYALRYLLNYPAAVAEIASIIRKEKIDIVHTNSLHNLYGFLAARISGRPHLWHVREIVLQSGLIRALEIFLAKHFGGKILVISDAVAEMFKDGNGRMPANLVRFPDAVDLDVYSPRVSGRKVLSDWNITPGTPVAGLVSRLDHWKGVEVFLKAAAICREKRPDVRYLVAGGVVEGREDYAAKMKQLAGSLGLGSVLNFTEWKYGPADMPQVYAALDVSVLASTWPEPFGLTVIEAMGCAKPVVAANHGGPRQTCIDGVTGYLVPPRDAEKMAEAMLALFNAPEKARAMGEAGRRHVEKYYNRKQQVKNLEKLYEGLKA